MNPSVEIETVIGRLVAGGNEPSALPLKKTVIRGQVLGIVADLTLTQHFHNPYSVPLELTYLFPVPHRAAVCGFELSIGARRVTGEIQELEQARQAYEQAVQEGQRAGLLEQRRPNLFAVRIGNVLPGEEIQATLRLQDRLRFEEGAFELVLPMGLTQRYHTPDHPDEEAETATTYAAPGEEIGPVEIELSIDAGVDVQEPRSPTHPLQIIRQDGRRFQVALLGSHLPNKDFILRYALVGQSPQAALWASPDPAGHYFLASVFPPALPEDFQAPRREFVFLLDRSGSMTGEAIHQARNALRACLRALNPEDTFSILTFDDQVEAFQRSSCPVTQTNIQKADAFLENVEGRGGTEILAALEAAFQLPADEGRARYIVFLTDGAVSAEARALEQVRQKIGPSRVFTFGIGPSVNRALLNQMASLGRGAAEFLQLNEDIEGAIIRFQDRVSFPLLTDLSLTWQGARAWDTYPARLPDLFAGQPLELCGRVQMEGSSARLLLRGKRAGQQIELELSLAPAPEKSPSLERVWARARLDDLIDQASIGSLAVDKARAEIISLALRHSLASPLTAFVAVDEEKATPGGSARKMIQVAQPLPEGLERGGFGPASAPPQGMPLPSTAARGIVKMASAPKSLMDRSANLGSGLDLPAFLRRKGSGPAPSAPAGVSAEEEPLWTGKEGALRLLARTQQVDGSWEGDPELTAAAVLAFIRLGHTTRRGSFRQVVKRASAWLAAHASQGLPAFLAALALQELAAATAQPVDQVVAEAARAALPAPASRLEQAALARLEGKSAPFSPPAALASLDDLRLAGILGINRPLEDALLKSKSPALVRAWLATI